MESPALEIFHFVTNFSEITKIFIRNIRDLDIMQNHKRFVLSRIIQSNQWYYILCCQPSSTLSEFPICLTCPPPPPPCCCFCSSPCTRPHVSASLPIHVPTNFTTQTTFHPHTVNPPRRFITSPSNFDCLNATRIARVPLKNLLLLSAIRELRVLLTNGVWRCIVISSYEIYKSKKKNAARKTDERSAVS